MQMWKPTVSSDELYHHGILGMSWGHKNGPPYPLDKKDYSSAEKKAARKAARAEKRAAKKEKKKIKHDLKQQKKADKIEAKRQEILRTGSLKEVRKLKGNMSNQEYQDVFKRLENEQRLDDFDKQRKVNAATKIKAAKSVVSDINSGTEAALKLYNRGAAVWNVVAEKKGWEPQDLPIIKVDGGGKKKKKDDDNSDDDD